MLKIFYDFINIVQNRQFYQKIRFKFTDPLKEGSPREVINFAVHQWSNPKTLNGEKYCYEHNHMTLYTVQSDGSWQHAFDVTHSEKENQMHMGVPLVIGKYPESTLILRSTSNNGNRGSRYFEVKVSDKGELYTIQVHHNDIIKANKNPTHIDDMRAMYPDISTLK